MFACVYVCTRIRKKGIFPLLFISEPRFVIFFFFFVTQSSIVFLLFLLSLFFVYPSTTLSSGNGIQNRDKKKTHRLIDLKSEKPVFSSPRMYARREARDAFSLFFFLEFFRFVPDATWKSS